MSTSALVESLKAAGQDFEWYPTTTRMVDVILNHINARSGLESMLDIGAGDGRVLMQVAKRHEGAKLYSIERSPVLQQAQPDAIIPVGAEFFEQNLMSLPVDVAFSNPPYSEFEEWAARIIATVHANSLYLIIPQRWQSSTLIAGALKTRGATAKVIHEDDFLDAERAARAVVHVIYISFAERTRWGRSETPDPFDAWFDANIDTFDKEQTVHDPKSEQGLARINKMETIPEMVAGFDEDYARMESNYKTIFTLDAGLLKELGVDKGSVREGLKTRMAGLKHTYWEALFRKLDVITTRLTTKTKKGFLGRLTGQTAIAFTVSNAHAVVGWAIKAANQYLDAQIVDVFRSLSTHDGVTNYKSNQKTWEKDNWRYNRSDSEKQHSHYQLDYRVVLHHYCAIYKSSNSFGGYDYPGMLHNSCHEHVGDLIAVFANLGFLVQDTPSRSRTWVSNQWQNFRNSGGDIVFQVKAFQNGNLHFRFMPDAIRTLNVEAGRLLGWLKSPQDVVQELGYTEAEAKRFFGANRLLAASSVKRLTAAA